METFSALLALCAGNSPVTGEFPAQRPVTQSFDAFFDLRLNKRLSKHSWGWCLRRHRALYDVIVMLAFSWPPRLCLPTQNQGQTVTFISELLLSLNYLSQSRLTRYYYHPVLSGILSKHRFLNMSSKYHLFLIKLYRDRSMVECHIPAIFHNDWFLNIKMSIDSFELMRPSTFCDDGNKIMVIPVRCMCALSMQISTIDRLSIRMWHGKTPQDVKNVLRIAEASHEHQ